MPKLLSTVSEEKCALSALVSAVLLWTQCSIVVLTLDWNFCFIFYAKTHYSLSWVSLKANELQNFPQLACDSNLKSSPICLCTWLMHVRTARSFYAWSDKCQGHIRERQSQLVKGRRKPQTVAGGFHNIQQHRNPQREKI